MKLPKYLLADNTNFAKDIFVIHTEYPRFIINLVDDEIEWLEEIIINNETELNNEINTLIKQASQFYDRELERYKNNKT